MNIINKQKTIVFDLQEYEGAYIDASYTIHSIDTKCCKIATVASSQVTDSFIELTLPDGNYQIEIIKDGVPEIIETFSVYYNYLSIFVSKFRKLICCSDCNACTGNECYLSKAQELFYEAFLQFNCLNLFSNLPLTRTVSCAQTRILNNEHQYKTYYGEFRFDKTEKLKEILITLYVELYFQAVSKLRNTETELSEINSVFSIEQVEKCLYKEDVDIQTLKDKLDNLKCDCNELL